MAYAGKTILLGLILGLSSGLVFSGSQKDLIDDLLKNYSPYAPPPTKENQTVEVELGFVILSIQSVDEASNSFTLLTWRSVNFEDERLKWDAKEYGFSTMRLPMKKIWFPDIVAYNRLSGSQIYGDAISPIVKYDGSVLVTLPEIVTVSCAMDLTYYPYDTQTCMIKYSSWTYDSNVLSLKLNRDKPELSDFIPHPEWKLVNASQRAYTVYYNCCPNTPYQYAELSFELERRSDPYTVKIVVPSVLTAFLVLFTFLLPSSSGEKIVFCLVLLLALIHISAFLQLTLPSNSESVLGEFITFALFLDFFATIIAVICYNIADGLLMRDKFGGPESEKHWNARKRKLTILRVVEYVFFFLFLIIFIIGTAVILCRRDTD